MTPKEQLIQLFKDVVFTLPSHKEQETYKISLRFDPGAGWYVDPYNIGENVQEYTKITSSFKPVILSFVRKKVSEIDEISSGCFTVEYTPKTGDIALSGRVYHEVIVFNKPIPLE